MSEHAIESRNEIVPKQFRNRTETVQVPELEMAQVAALEQSKLSWKHANNTLIILYPKPAAVLAAEQEEKADRRKLASRPEGAGGLPGEIPPDCKQQ